MNFRHRRKKNILSDVDEEKETCWVSHMAWNYLCLYFIFVMLIILLILIARQIFTVAHNTECHSEFNEMLNFARLNLKWILHKELALLKLLLSLDFLNLVLDHLHLKSFLFFENFSKFFFNFFFVSHKSGRP